MHSPPCPNLYKVFVHLVRLYRLQGVLLLPIQVQCNLGAIIALDIERIAAGVTIEHLLLTRPITMRVGS